MEVLGKSGSGGFPRFRRRSMTAAGRGPGSRISSVSHRGCAMQACSASEHHGRPHVSSLKLNPAAPPTAPTRVMLCKLALCSNGCGILPHAGAAAAGRSASLGSLSRLRIPGSCDPNAARRGGPLPCPLNA